MTMTYGTAVVRLCKKCYEAALSDYAVGEQEQKGDYIDSNCFKCGNPLLGLTSLLAVRAKLVQTILATYCGVSTIDTKRTETIMNAAADLVEVSTELLKLQRLPDCIKPKKRKR